MLAQGQARCAHGRIQGRENQSAALRARQRDIEQHKHPLPRVIRFEWPQAAR
jgi:hypothetical protein